jgi:adenine-specific DNA methylase
MDAKVAKPKIVPFSLRDAPSLIERVWPVQKLSAEAQKERLGAQSQTLTPLGSYWKGRKPLILVRACVIASMLPATGDDSRDLEVLELLIGLSDEQIQSRLRGALTMDEIKRWASVKDCASLLEEEENDGKITLSFKKGIPRVERDRLIARVLSKAPYISRVEKLARPEEVSESDLIAPYLDRVNSLYGTSAQSLAQLIEQLGIMRFGRIPRVGDTFSGGGSIPFEAARMGCDVLRRI